MNEGEPISQFASHIAKYFSNSIREDGLLAVATAGIVFAPGGAGTMQEIFQDAAQNAYKVFGRSPMVFLDRRHYCDDTGLYPALQRQAERLGFADLLSVADEPAEILDRFPAQAVAPRRLGHAATGPDAHAQPPLDAGTPRAPGCADRGPPLVRPTGRSVTMEQFKNRNPEGEHHVQDHFPREHHRDAGAVRRRSHGLRAGPRGALRQQRRQLPRGPFQGRPPRPTSPRARAASGSACTTTGPIRTASSSRRPTRTPGAARSGHTYTFTRNADGTTDIDYVVVREGKNLKGRFLALLFKTVGKSKLEKAFTSSVKAIEARNYGPATAGPRPRTASIPA